MRPANIIAFFLIVMAVYAGANLYLGKRIFQCVSALYPKTNAAVFAAIYAALAILTLTLNFATFAAFPTAIREALRWSGGCWIGFFLYALMLFLAADAALAVGRLSKLIPSPVPPNIRLYAGLAVITLTAALIAYGMINANRIKVTSYNVRLNNKTLPGGMKIALASDLHLGAAGSERRLPKIIAAINDQKPDLICLAGDIFNNNYGAISDPDAASALIRSLNATHGVYACPGNHDAGKDVVEMAYFLERSGVKLLSDEFDIVNGQTALIGRLDPRPIGGFGGKIRAPISKLMSRTADGTSVALSNKRGAVADQAKRLTISGSMPIIVIDHNPKSIHEYGDEVDLVLSGHTHHGQLFPANLITKTIYAADYGHYQKEPRAPNLIVTSGAGTWGPPMRVGTNCEIVCVTLF